MRNHWVSGIGIAVGLLGLWWASEEGRVAEAELKAAEEWAVGNRQLSDSLLDLEGAVGKLSIVVQGEKDRRQLLEQIRTVQQSCGVQFSAKLPELGQRRGNVAPVVKQVVSGCKFEGTVESFGAFVATLEKSEPFWVRVGRVEAQAATQGQVYAQAEQIGWVFDLEYLEQTISQ